VTNISPRGPNSTLVQASDGTLYGTTAAEHGPASGTVFRIRPNGSGFAVLKRFTNSLEGSELFAGLALSENALFGTTRSGGLSDAGTVFRLNTDGTGFSVLKHFTGNADEGGDPRAGLIVSGNVLYGTTSVRGGNSRGWGSVFKLNTDGTGFTVLKEFLEQDGNTSFVPGGRLTVSGDFLYGTTTGGLMGSPLLGTVFKLKTDGTGFDTLRGGLVPRAGVTLKDGVLYGTSDSGGRSNQGTVFRLNTDGTGYRVLKEFSGADGAQPSSDLVLSSGVLYGTTSVGGSFDGGTVFRINTDGSDFRVLREIYTGDLDDGYWPSGGLLLSDGVLYGTTAEGGLGTGGILFRLNTDGSDFAVVKDFGASIGDAVFPESGVTASGGQLYGTTSNGGDFGQGTIYSAQIHGAGYRILKHFKDSPKEGAAPDRDLLVSDGVLYGVTSRGGSANMGTLFRMNTDGTAYRVLTEFRRTEEGYFVGGLTLADQVLYVSTRVGGASNAGTLFRMDTDGTGRRIIKEFRGGDGENPSGKLVVSRGVLYGTTYSGGRSNVGTVFRVNTDGTDFLVLKHFTGFMNHGAGPFAGVILSGSFLYGTTGGLGGAVSGTLFKMNTNGTDYVVLRTFGGVPGDGRYPAELQLAANGVLYGVTLTGGRSQKGTLFKIHVDGSGYAILKDFERSDESTPNGSLTVWGDRLYGTTQYGGDLGFGTLFALELSPRISLTSQSLDQALILRWDDATFTLQAAPAVTAAYTNVPGARSPYTNATFGSQTFFRLIGP